MTSFNLHFQGADPSQLLVFRIGGTEETQTIQNQQNDAKKVFGSNAELFLVDVLNLVRPENNRKIDNNIIVLNREERTVFMQKKTPVVEGLSSILAPLFQEDSSRQPVSNNSASNQQINDESEVPQFEIQELEEEDFEDIIQDAADQQEAIEKRLNENKKSKTEGPSGTVATHHEAAGPLKAKGQSRKESAAKEIKAQRQKKQEQAQSHQKEMASTEQEHRKRAKEKNQEIDTIQETQVAQDKRIKKESQ